MINDRKHTHACAPFLNRYMCGLFFVVVVVVVVVSSFCGFFPPLCPHFFFFKNFCKRAAPSDKREKRHTKTPLFGITFYSRSVLSFVLCFQEPFACGGFEIEYIYIYTYTYTYTYKMMSCVFASSPSSSRLTSGRFSNDSSKTTVVHESNRNVFVSSNTNQRRLRRGRRGLLAFQRAVVVSSSSTKEQEDYDRRFQESTNAGLMLNGNRAPRGGDSPPEGRWSWTLNWDYMTFDRETEVPIENPSEQELKECSMLIGSCPRSPGDIDRLIDEAGVEAIVCLQCEMCHEAMEIDWEPIRKRCLERNVVILRVSVRDFDRLDQSRRLADMTRAFNLLHDGLGRKTYVHCTAGINRASLTVLGYLTFCRGMELQKAMNIIRTCRPQSNPYEVSWQRARKMLLSERVEDLYLYANTDGGGCSKEEGGDWIARDMDKAERGIIQQMFQRSLEVDKGLSHALLNLNQDGK